MTAMQQRYLQLCLRFRGRRMAIAGLLWASRRIYAVLLLLFSAAAGLLYILVTPAAPAYVGSALVVVILRDIGYFRRSVMLWPVLEQVLDWNHVEQLARRPKDKSKTGG